MKPPTDRLRLTLVLMTFCLVINVAGRTNGDDPHLAYAYPAGCQRGTEAEILVGGQHLKDAREIYVAGDGVEATIVGWYRPMTAGEYNDLRMALQAARELLIEQRAENKIDTKPTEQEVAEAAGVLPEQLREMEIYRQRQNDPRRQPNDQLEEQVTVRLTVAADAEVGKRELRFQTESAISNPLWVHVGQWPEICETEPNDLDPDTSVESFPVVINGQILPGESDRFSFPATKGMKLVIQVAARDVIPYLADAVPGWFQAVISLRDSSGKEVSYADSFHYRQDPVIYFEVPQDDQYTVEIRDSLYRGREDFVYRMTLGEIPFVTSVFPLGGQIDSQISVQLRGWNLSQPVAHVVTMPRRQYRPMRWYDVPQRGGVSVQIPFQIDYWPEAYDREPNNDFASAQEISNRMTINGRIDRPGDQDVFVIDKGGRLVAEVYARRLGSPLDSVLTLTDIDGNEIAFNDDHEDVSQAMLTHHADSLLTASLPANGPHFLQIADAQGNGGDEFCYRLHLRAPEKDYELRVVPSSIVARPGQIVPITVFALRHDGFDQDIELSLVDAPNGFRIDGGIIPGQADRVRLTLKVPDEASAQPITLEMEGTASSRFRSRTKLTRPAVPAENMMQAFIWHHLVPVENWNVVVSGRRVAKLPVQVVLPEPRVTLPREGSFRLRVIQHGKPFPWDQWRVQLSDPPAGLTAEIVEAGDASFDIEFTLDEQVEPGLRGNLMITLSREFTVEPSEPEATPQKRRMDYGWLPAIPFEISERKTSRR